MPVVFATIKTSLKLYPEKEADLKKIKALGENPELNWWLSYTAPGENSAGWCFPIYMVDIQAGTPRIEVMDDYLQFTFDGVVKLSLRTSLAKLLLADEKPRVTFDDVNIYIPKTQNTVRLIGGPWDTEFDQIIVPIEFSKSKPKVK